MAVSLLIYLTFHVTVFSLLIHGLPSMTIVPDSAYSSSPSSSVTPGQEASHTCEESAVPLCASYYSLARLPNVYGHGSQREAEAALASVWVGQPLQPGSLVSTFFCLLYFPPCAHARGDNLREEVTPLPCRELCERAVQGVNGGDWPVSCNVLPTENCYSRDGSGSVVFLRKSITATPTRATRLEVPQFAPVDTELGYDDGGYEVEVVSMATGQSPARRYDIVDLGDPAYFRGWADVQGTGAANDYCRVIGRSKKKFISCNLAGSSGQGHKYVSKLGFDPGFNNTWFMRDMDGDGRDDYCRCTRTQHGSKVTCMKAGQQGFYGSSTEGGSQYSFDLPGSQGCREKVVNPWFGE